MQLSFRLIILWLHILGVVIWVGGLLFQLLVITPTLTRAASVRERLRLGLSLEARFRSVMWPAVGLVLLTGLYNVMNVWYAITLAGGSVPPTFVRVLGIKLLLVALMLVLQAVQQFVVRPRRIAALGRVAADAHTLPEEVAKLQRLSQLLHILTVSCAAAVVLFAVQLRG